jgi:hypothetical protein
MGLSMFSGAFDKNPDLFDGEAQFFRDGKTKVNPDLYQLLKELGYQSIKRQKEATDGAAGTATAEHPFHLFDGFIKSIQRVVYIPTANLTADNTNFATLIVRARKASGALSSIIAQATTQITGSGNWTAFVPVTLPLTDATAVLPLGHTKLDMLDEWTLTWEITKTASGIAVPSGCLQVFVK